jgi:nitrile hydratase accessory protein
MDLDTEGPAAPPRLNGELVFDQPWQSRIFATTMALCEKGVIGYEDFRDRLIAQIADHPDQYWHSWCEALEGLLVGRGLCEADEVTERARRFAEHD